jgi:hypothetical protein
MSALPKVVPKPRRRRSGTAAWHMSRDAVDLSLAQIYAMDEKTCREFLIKARWGSKETIRCPSCGTNPRSFSTGRWNTTVEHDLEEELTYLAGLERARAALKDEIDWPAQSLDLFINVVRQNGGSLSKTKRDSHFSWLTPQEEARFVPAVNEAFDSPLPSQHTEA